jgi:hypothetical protein
MMTPFQGLFLLGSSERKWSDGGVTPIRRRSIVGEIIVAGPPQAIFQIPGRGIPALEVMRCDRLFEITST